MQVLHLELDISGSNMHYHPGDSIGVMPENADEMVASLIKRLGVQRDAVFTVEAVDSSSEAKLLPHLNYPCTVHSALKVPLPPCMRRRRAPSSLGALGAQGAFWITLRRAPWWRLARGGRTARRLARAEQPVCKPWPWHAVCSCAGRAATL